MRKSVIAFAAIVGALGATPAHAEPARAVAAANVRAGPGTEFPRVASLRAGQPIDVRGCLDDRSWCDISWNGRRGWVSARFLSVAIGGGRGDIWSNRNRVRIATSNWDMNSYWQENYRGQSFYNQRDHYRNYGPHPQSQGQPQGPSGNGPGHNQQPAPQQQQPQQQRQPQQPHNQQNQPPQQQPYN